MKPTRILAFIAALLCAGQAFAQGAYPSKPIKVIVPFAPGTGPEQTVRIIGEKFVQSTGQPLVIENKGGAGGNIGTDALAKSAPDGYTLGLIAINMLVINPHLYKDMPYDPVRDFEPIMQVTNTNHVLAINGGVPANSLAEFVAWVKANPGKVNISTNGAGTTPHLLGVLLNQNTGTDLLAVHYKGGGEAVKDLVGGHVQAMFGSPFQMQPFLASGKVKILATTRGKRVDILPNVPTFAELGYPDMIADAWTAFMAPAGTPAPIIQRLSAEFTRIVGMPEVIRTFEKDGYTLVGSTPAETGQMIRRELQRWGGVVKASGWKVQ
jgi:tripartite-type tricarboxylate transporter receptor subunit TctC